MASRRTPATTGDGSTRRDTGRTAQPRTETTSCRADGKTWQKYWERIPGKGYRNKATGRVCARLYLDNYTTKDVPVDLNKPTQEGAEGLGGPDSKKFQDQAAKEKGMTDPNIMAIDTTNPMVKGLLEMLVTQATSNMQNPRAGGNQFAGPTAQLFPQGLQRFNPGNVGGPGLTPPGGPTGPGMPIYRPPLPPGPPQGPVRPIPGMGGPDPRVQPGTGRTPIRTDDRPNARNFSPTEQLLAEMGLLGEEFQPVSSGSRYMNAFQPQYINQYTGARRF